MRSRPCTVCARGIVCCTHVWTPISDHCIVFLSHNSSWVNLMPWQHTLQPRLLSLCSTMWWQRWDTNSSSSSIAHEPNAFAKNAYFSVFKNGISVIWTQNLRPLLLGQYPQNGWSWPWILQSGASSLAKHGGAYFSAIYGSLQDPIATPGPYENQEP